jgi:hypothetical protein
MRGPPLYLTPDWDEAERSVSLLAKLEPDLVISGRGRPMKGEHVRQRLHELATNFQAIAVPVGRPYVLDPAKPGTISNDAYR